MVIDVSKKASCLIAALGEDTGRCPHSGTLRQGHKMLLGVLSLFTKLSYSRTLEVPFPAVTLPVNACPGVRPEVKESAKPTDVSDGHSRVVQKRLILMGQAKAYPRSSAALTHTCVDSTKESRNWKTFKVEVRKCSIALMH